MLDKMKKNIIGRGARPCAPALLVMLMVASVFITSCTTTSTKEKPPFEYMPNMVDTDEGASRGDFTAKF